MAKAAVDGRPRAREGFMEGLSEGLYARRHLEGQVGKDEAFHRVGQRHPVHTAGNEVHHLASRRPGRHAPYVVKVRIPPIPASFDHAGETVREAPELWLTLQNRHPPAPQMGQQRSDGHPAHTGANDDGVESPEVVHSSSPASSVP